MAGGEFGTAAPPRKPCVFIGNMIDFGDERKTGAFGASIVAFWRYPKWPQARMQLYKHKTHRLGEIGGLAGEARNASIRAPNARDLLDLIWKFRESGCCVWSTYSSTIVPPAILYP